MHMKTLLYMMTWCLRFSNHTAIVDIFLAPHSVVYENITVLKIRYYFLMITVQLEGKDQLIQIKICFLLCIFQFDV